MGSSGSPVISSAHQKDSCMNLFTPSHYHESLNCLKLEHFLCGEKKTLGFGMGWDGVPRLSRIVPLKASSSSDFERPVATAQPRAVISSAHQKDSCMNLFTACHYHESLNCLKLNHLPFARKQLPVRFWGGKGWGPAVLL